MELIYIIEMAIPLKNLTKEEIEKQWKDFPGVQKCAICYVPLQKTITGSIATSEGRVCSDCYFGMFGDELDLHPIGMPVRKR